MSKHRAKVLCVMNVPMVLSGITLSTLLYIGNMDKDSVQVDFVAISEPPEEVKARLNELGAKLIVIENRLKNPVGYMLRLARAARGYDIMHVHGNSRTMAIDMLAGFLAGVRVRVAHTHNTQCKYKFAHKMLKPLFNALTTARYACSEEAGNWIFGGRPFSVARVAIDSGKFAFDEKVREEARAELNAGSVTLLGCVANFNPAKNHAFLIELFAEYLKIDPSARLLLVGGGALRADAEARARRLGVLGSVIFAGARADVWRVCQALDAALLPSLYEGFPNVLLEFQCAGLTALASDTVTRAADLTGRVKFLPISAGTKPWVDALTTLQGGGRAANSADGIEKVRAAGHDIVENARKLQEFYVKMACEK